MQSVTYRFSKSQSAGNPLSVIALVLLVFALGNVLTSGVASLEIPALEGLAGRGDSGRLLTGAWIWGGLGAIAALMVAFHRFEISPTRNSLSIDDVGLTYVRRGVCHRWPWSAVASVETKRRRFGMRAARVTVTGRFGWTARLAMLLMNGRASADRAVITLPDSYEMPIDDVVAGINEYRARIRGTATPAKAADRTPLRSTAEPAPSITYTKSPLKRRAERIAQYVQLPTEGVPAGVLFYIAGNESLSERLRIDGTWSLLLGLFAIVGLILSILLYRAKAPERNTLRLDPAGLTYQRHGKRHGWPWQDLSAFEYRIVTRKGLPVRRRIVTFSAPGRDWTWRWLLRPAYGLPKTPPVVVIEDIYETTLEDIAATLNAYRERALGGGGEETSEPQAPEPA